MGLTGYFDDDDPSHYRRISDTAIVYMLELFTPETDFYAALKEAARTRVSPFLLRQDVPDIYAGISDLHEKLGDTVMARNLAEAALRVLEEAQTEAEQRFALKLRDIYTRLPNALERVSKAFEGKAIGDALRETLEYALQRIEWCLRHPRPSK